MELNWIKFIAHTETLTVGISRYYNVLVELKQVTPSDSGFQSNGIQIQI